MSWTRKKKKYKKPKKLYDKTRIEEENVLVKKYGLKNKREIWKAEAAVSRIRNQAKRLITSSREEQEKIFNKLNKIGFKIEKISDILDLNKEDWLKRRLQSVLIMKKLAKPREARQLITHKHVSIDRNVVNIPSYIVKVDEENKIQIIKKFGKPMEKKEEEKGEKAGKEERKRGEKGGEKREEKKEEKGEEKNE